MSTPTILPPTLFNVYLPLLYHWPQFSFFGKHWYLGDSKEISPVTQIHLYLQ